MLYECTELKPVIYPGSDKPGFAKLYGYQILFPLMDINDIKQTNTAFLNYLQNLYKSLLRMDIKFIADKTIFYKQLNKSFAYTVN